MKTIIKSQASALLMSAALLFTAPFAAAETEFKVALGGSADGGQHALATHFADTLKQKTNGEFSARLFMNSQLGSEQDTVNDAALGVLDFSVVAINNITPFSPTVGIFTLPYMIQSLDEAVKLTQSDVAKEMVDNTIRDAGVRIVGWTFSGFRVLTNSKKPVTKLEDLQGMIIRVPKNEIMIDTYRAWGVNPTPMSWAELFTALQQQVVDGQDLSIVDIEAVKFDEVQTYISNIHYNFLLEPMIMSEAIFQEQSPEVQAAILEAGQQATLHSADFLRSKEAIARDSLIKKGMKISDVTDEDQWISKATTTVWPKYYDSVGGKAKINNALRELGRNEL